MNFQGKSFRLNVRGINLNRAADNLPEDQLPIATNVRPNQQGTLSTRPSIQSFLTPGSGNPIHSLKSFNAASVNRTFSGAGTNLYSDATQVDTGYSGNPLTWASYQPAEAVEPFLYVADSSRYRKIRASDGACFAVGTAPPGAPPSAELAVPLYSVVSDFDSVSGWTQAGAAGMPSYVLRVPAGTTTAVVLYDSGSTGWASVAFSTSGTEWLTKGARIAVNTESQVVSQVIPAALGATTIIAAIQYDSGTTGLCCVVLASNTTALDRNSLVQLGSEYVRVLSAAVGEDNSVSFRCSTTGAHSASETVTTFDCARMYFTGSHSSGESVTGDAVTFPVMLAAAPVGTVNTLAAAVTWASGSLFFTDGSWNGLPIVVNNLQYVVLSVTDNHHLTLTTSAGTQTGVSYTVSVPTVGTLTSSATLDLSQITGRPVGPDDWMHISVALDVPANLELMQILLDVDATENNFTKNFYWATITSNALQAASTGTQTVSAAQAAQTAQPATTASLEQQLEYYEQQYNSIPAQYRLQAGAYLLAQITALEAQIASGQTAITPNSIIESELATGLAAWSEIFIPISSLTRSGTDSTRSLSDVKAIRILVNAVNSVNVVVDSWWVGGTYGPNAPEAVYPDSPMRYCFRYRSTISGAQSTWSPLTRGGLFAERQSVNLSGAGSSDTQVDTVDIARVGASVNGTPQELASVPNSSTWTYVDNYSDAQLEDQIEITDFQPWPVQQNPITGTCSVVGTSVFSTSVAVPSNLCAGTLVIVNGTSTTILGAPGTHSFQVADNIPVGSVVPFQINSPTTYGNPLPYVTGPYNEAFFAWGDPVNPGRVYYTNAGNPETANTRNFIDLTSSTEPGMGICTWNGYVVAMTADRFFAGTSTGQEDNPYAFSESAVGCGLLTPWCFDTGPAIFFLSRNGIMVTDLGPAKSLSEQDLFPFLPHEGQAGVSVNGYSPPVLSPVPRLSYCRDGWLYFDYQTGAGPQATLAFNTQAPGWWPDVYTPGAVLHSQSEAPNSLLVLLGATDGTIHKYASTAADTGGAISCEVRTPCWDMGDSRADKLFGDILLDALIASGNITFTAGFNGYGTLLTAFSFAGVSRSQQIYDLNSGAGQHAKNIAIDAAWTGLATLYEVQPSFISKPESIARRYGDWQGSLAG